ncbi:hypothetical protein EDB83DRAFT_2518582 [Lactarius deliciosus]|nr:hypothetical protein EDB83DRAFT_2518582 [Lactarius deliciosus]
MDKDDGDFSIDKGSTSVSSGEDQGADEGLTNVELASILPSKSAPTTGYGSGKRKCGVNTTEDEDLQLPSQYNAKATGNLVIEDTQHDEAAAPCRKRSKEEALKKNPIHYFYRQVDHGTDGTVGNPGDKHFKCYHGNRKIITLTKSMKYNLTTLVNHLKHSFPSMYKLFSILKDRSSDQHVTQEEMDVASGKKVLGLEKAKEWFDALEHTSENLHQAFRKQEEVAAGPWDQDKFEQLIAEWIVTCDQPFDKVDKPQFRDMLSYAHHPSPTLKIPH